MGEEGEDRVAAGLCVVAPPPKTEAPNIEVKQSYYAHLVVCTCAVARWRSCYGFVRKYVWPVVVLCHGRQFVGIMTLGGMARQYSRRGTAGKTFQAKAKYIDRIVRVGVCNQTIDRTLRADRTGVGGKGSLYTVQAH